MSAKQAINDKLQGSGGVANNQIMKGLLLSSSVIFFKSAKAYLAKLQART